MKSVLVIGGKGFIGYHLVNLLKERKYQVSIATRKPGSEKEYLDCPIVHLDLANFSDEIISSVLSPFEIVVFAGGADDRTMPNEPAVSFFYKENVLPCVRLAEVGQLVGLEKLIILGSYFTYFNRIRPEWKMAKYHPYVRSRVLQQEETIKAAGDRIKIEVLELPYIFGSSPEKTPLWKPLVKYIDALPVIFYTKGGTAMIGVDEVAKSIIGAIEYKGTEGIWQISAENKSWTEMIHLISSALGKKRQVILVPTVIVRFFSWLTKVYFKLSGKQSGLDIYQFITTQTNLTYMYTEESMRLLDYGQGDLKRSIEETVNGSGY